MSLGLLPRRRRVRVLPAIGLLCAALITAGAASAGSGALTISSVGITSGQTLSGSVAWTASASGAVNHVSFFIDGSLRYTDQTAPYTFNGDGNTLDTTTLPNGSHVFGVAAYPNAGKGQSVSTSVTATISNAVTTPTPTPTSSSSTATPSTTSTSAPVSTGAPVISGSAVVGQTLTAATGTWSGTTPMTYAYQWIQCDSSGAGCNPIAGASSSTYLLTTAQARTTVRVQVTATNSAGSASAQSAQTAVIAAATETFDTVTAYLDSPVPDLTNAITVSSASAFSTAVANAKAGQTINVLGNVLVPGEFTGFNRVVSGGTVNVVFQPGAGFTGMAGSRYPAVWLKNAGGWRIWGGTITNPDGNGILVYAMPGPVVWTGFSVSDTGDTCVAVYPVGGDISNLTLKGVAGTADPNLSFDPHAEKGTGIHAWNIGDGGTGVVNNSTFAADVRNQATGAGVEWDEGQTGPGNVLYTRARNLGFAIPGTTWLGYAQQQTAGNVVQLWGATAPSSGSLDVKYAEGNTIQGRMLETNGAYPGASYASSSLEYGIATGPIMQSPLVDSPAYDTGSTGIRLGNVSPTP